MESSYTNIAIRTSNRRAVIDCLRKLKRTAFVSRLSGGVVFVYDRECQTEPREVVKLGKKLSADLGSASLAMMNRDDNKLCYWLLSGKKTVDKYDSTPGYYDGIQVRPPKGGVASLLVKEFGARAAAARIEAVLRRKSGAGGQYIFAADRHRHLAEALGVDAGLSGIGFAEIAAGVAPKSGTFVRVEPTD